MKISLLISSLPTQSTTARMRVWRSLKASGAATLRDGSMYSQLLIARNLTLSLTILFQSKELLISSIQSPFQILIFRLFSAEKKNMTLSINSSQH